VVSTVLGRSRGRALVVLATPLEAAAIEEGLLPVLPRLTARHQVVVAAVTDPRVAQMRSAARTESADAYETAAAARAELERAAVTARLVRSGVHVVEGEPDRLPPRLADAYLDLKAAGRL